MSEITLKARAKLKDELSKIQGDKRVTAIALHVSKTLDKFCVDERFAVEVCKPQKTLKLCCEKVVEGVKTHISDIEVYKKAAKYYFPDCKVDFKLEIILGESEPTQVEGEEVKETKSPKEKPVTKLKKKEIDNNIMQLSLF